MTVKQTGHDRLCSGWLLVFLLTLFFSDLSFAQGTFNEAESVIEEGCEDDHSVFLSQTTAQRLRSIQNKVPLDYNEFVQNYIDIYTVRKKVTTERCLGRSQKYFPAFEEVFARYGVPDEMKYLAVIESALNPLAVSKKGATGIFQFMLSTAKIYGLKINKLVDERRDPYLSAEAAARYLLNSYARYGNWLHVIASYNCGPGNVDKAIKRAGGSTNFWDIYPYLPKETRGYVPAFIAAMYAMTYHRELGIQIQYPEECRQKRSACRSATRWYSTTCATGWGCRLVRSNIITLPCWAPTFLPASTSCCRKANWHCLRKRRKYCMPWPGERKPHPSMKACRQQPLLHLSLWKPR